MIALFYSTDLFFFSRLASVVQELGGKLEMISSADPLLERSAEAEVRLIILDLTAPALDLAELVAGLKNQSPTTKIIAFGPHVQQAKLDAAKKAQCDEVFTRGSFNQQMNSILAGYLSSE